LASAAKGNHEVPAIKPLETLLVEFKPLAGTQAFLLEAIPDTGANITAIPATAASGIELCNSNIVLRAANSSPLRVVGAYYACISLQHNSTDKVVYIIRGLSRPLLLKTTMRELGLLHPDFPFQEPSTTHQVRLDFKRQPLPPNKLPRSPNDLGQ
jgi:hypothetical protein